MLGATYGDLVSRPKTTELTSAEMRELERRREAVRALLRDIAKPSGSTVSDARRAA